MTKPTKPVSEIDRLIELASDEKPRLPSIANEAASPIHSLSLEDQKDPRPSMWRVLIQLRVLLPYLVKVLPLVERGLLGTNITGRAAPTIDTSALDREIAGVGEAQRDLNTAVKAQTADIHLLQEQVAVLIRSLEKDQLLNEKIAESLTSLRKLVTTSVAVMIVLLVVLIGLVVFGIAGHQFRAG
jgi:hypothetical protein